MLARAVPRDEARHLFVTAYDVEPGSGVPYTTNLPLEDFLTDGALLATHWQGRPLTQDHGGPMRAMVPHLYFWKSAKWLNGLQFTERDEPGFWELRGYHIYGDPWREQRFAGD